ncbi:MAG: hypothetical protein U0840_10780 [Gemmataceae bacterium]
MNNDTLAPPAPERAASPWPFGWLGLFALGWVVYELTHSPGVASVLICLKFGWEDFQTGWWLWRQDDHPGRRRSLVSLYLGWGLWKTAAVAFLMSVAYAMITPRELAQPAAPQSLIAFVGTFVASLASFIISAVLTLSAVVGAWRGGHRLWLDRAVHRARRHDVFPPTPFCLGRSNSLALPLITALCFLALFLVVTMLVVAQLTPITAFVGFTLAIFIPVMVVVLREMITSQVWAETPEECWPEGWEPFVSPGTGPCES